MHVVIVGAGSLGSAIAVELVRAGHDVTLLCRGARLERLRTHPVELERDGMVHSARVPVEEAAALARPVDAAIFCTKMADLASVARELAPRLAPGATAVTLQNGVEAPTVLADCLPRATVIAGRVHGFFEMAGDRVRHVGVPPAVVIGGTGPDRRATEGLACELLRQAGFTCEASPDIARELWLKLMLAAGLAGVGTMLGVPAGQVCRTAAHEAILRQALGEVVSVARACSVGLTPGDVEPTLAFARAFPPEATTSLQRDLAGGLPSEYDALIGAVLRLAAQHHVPVPTFKAIEAAVRPTPQR